MGDVGVGRSGAWVQLQGAHRAAKPGSKHARRSNKVRQDCRAASMSKPAC